MNARLRLMVLATAIVNRNQRDAEIGDQPNDVLMFKRSGFSIAMGNAFDEVKSQAAATTGSYNDKDFAQAVECFILRFV